MPLCCWFPYSSRRISCQQKPQMLLIVGVFIIFCLLVSLSSEPRMSSAWSVSVFTASRDSRNTTVPKLVIPVNRQTAALDYQKSVLSDQIVRRSISKMAIRAPKYFRPRISHDEKFMLMRTLSAFVDACGVYEITHFLYGGSLIGSYRHFDLVPWDDDVDVMVPLSQRKRLLQALTELGPEYVLSQHQVASWKLYSSSATPIPGHNWNWPFLDIFFFDENATHIWDVHPMYARDFVYPKSIIFPLRKRPFMSLLMPAPADPLATLKRNYDMNLCVSNTWIHRWESWGKFTSLSCSRMTQFYSFVSRVPSGTACNETLEMDGETLSYFLDYDARRCPPTLVNPHGRVGSLNSSLEHSAPHSRNPRDSFIGG